MRLALLSDVHSNLHALESVLEDVQASEPDRICFLGDAVGYNAYPQQCVDLLEETCQVAVLGNHDKAVLQGGEEWFNPSARAGVEHSRKQLTDQGIAYLESMVDQTAVDGVHLVHGSPRGPTTEYVFPDAPQEMLEKIAHHPAVKKARVLAMGHTHVPFVRDMGETVLCNVGSVGQPRDGDPRACWALVDSQAASVEFHRVDYDIDAAAEAIHKAHLPSQLATRLYDGR